MMTGISTIVQAGGTAFGVDTHKDLNVAFALDHLGRRVDERSAPTTATGSNDLLAWARQLGPDRVWGIEGTGSYGAGLTRVLRAAGETVHEVSRPNRRVRRDRGKSDPIDAEVAARNVLAGQAQGAPKAGTGVIEALRQLRATRRSVLKARTQAANLLHALLLTAPADLRAELDQGSMKDIVQRCTRLRPGLSPRNGKLANSRFDPLPAAGGTFPRRSPSSIPQSRNSPRRPHPRCSTTSASAQTWPRRCSSRPAGTPIDSAMRPASLRCAGSVRYRLHRARPTGTR